MPIRFFSPLCVALGLWSGASLAEDAIRGEQVFKKCKSCHEVGDGAKKRTGPPLNNIIDARAALNADFRYSPAMKKAAEGGLHWSLEELAGYLENPKAFMPGTKMSFRGLKDEADRNDVIAYLATFSGHDLAVIKDEGFVLAPEVLAVEGDIDYGEYLSSECTTCHQSDGANEGIPGIVGWDVEPFVTAMHAYREKHRDNEVMQLVTGRLNDEEIASLALYFNSLADE